MSDMQALGPSSEVRAHEQAVSSSIREIVRELTALLGATIVAAIGGVSETRAVQQWMNDREPQRPQVLRFALQLAWIVCEKTDKQATRSWFQQNNPYLNDSVPLMLLREKELGEIQGPMIAAARAFTARPLNHTA